MPKLKIVSVNDVYSLEHLPRLKSLVDHHRRGEGDQHADAVLVVLAGDFLAPSLLSSMDAGRGMVECLNAIGVTHVVLGNHEDDIAPEQLRRRLTELSAKCLGTNVRPTSSASLDLPANDLVDVGGIRVALVGAVMADSSVYRGKPFGGVELLPANDAILAETATLLASGCAAVIPITHQWMADDRALADAQRSPRFPVIVGGHEHVPMVVEVGGTWIVKAGSEAARAVITEIEWRDGGATTTVRLEEVAGFPEDAELRALVDRHMGPVRELARATLFYVKPGELLSSKGTRRQQTTVGTLICSRLRDCLGADACVFNGGGIRAARDYDERFTYGDVEAEVPFDNEVVVAPLPGRVLRDAVAASRAKAPAESGAFLQVDDRIVVDGANQIVAVDGAPLEPDRVYRVAIVRQLLLGLDHVEPLMRWAEANPSLVPPSGSGREPKMVLVQSFALEIWRELGGFEAIDTDHDDRVTSDEIAARIAQRHPSQAPSTLLANLVLRAVDADADHVISRADATALASVAPRPPAVPRESEPDDG